MIHKREKFRLGEDDGYDNGETMVTMRTMVTNEWSKVTKMTKLTGFTAWIQPGGALTGEDPYGRLMSESRRR
jgi:hypothetical protein